jgi:hypothetical protein
MWPQAEVAEVAVLITAMAVMHIFPTINNHHTGI